MKKTKFNNLYFILYLILFLSFSLSYSFSLILDPGRNYGNEKKLQFLKSKINGNEINNNNKISNNNEIANNNNEISDNEIGKFETLDNFGLNYERKFYFSIQSFQNDKSFDRYLKFLLNTKASGITFYGFHKKIEINPVLILAGLKEKIDDLQIFIAGDNFDFFKTISENDELMNFIDGFHIEYEYWNYYKYKKKDRIEAFNFFIEESKKISLLAKEKNKKLEAYFGWFNEDEAKSFLPIYDFILLHAYTKEPQNVWQYIQDRFIILNKINSDFVWSVLCSAEPDFMQQSLKQYGIDKLEEIIFGNIETNLKIYNSISNQDFNYLKNFKGFYWFTGELVEKAIR